ncbi:hypothetical protein BaRGS_00006110 [Batillaria attramentaria]|uniref:Uncharacterized protein n=1 Tax=Batillaria attramentaria TaxID=370345 RepID=A0ABD0LSH6_9CAEN
MDRTDFGSVSGAVRMLKTVAVVLVVLYNGGVSKGAALVEAEVSNCSAQVLRTNWSVVGSCDVSKGNASLDFYEYSLVLYWGTSKFLFQTVPFSGLKKFYLNPYTNSTDGKQYLGGTVEFSVPLPQHDGNHSMEFRIFPGYDSYMVARRYAYYRMNLQQLLRYVSWFTFGDFSVGDTVLAAGDYGVTQLQFPSNKVDRRHDGTEIGCRVDWAVKKTVSVTKSVAYGPDDVDITYWEVVGTDGSTIFIVSCSVVAANPLTPDMVQWGGLCQGQTGFTCILTEAPGHGGNEVTCTAVNSANNDHSARATVTIQGLSVVWSSQTNRTSGDPVPFPAKTGPSKDKSGSGGLTKGVAIGSAIALAVLFAAIIAALFILWKRGGISLCYRGSGVYHISGRKL